MIVVATKPVPIFVPILNDIQAIGTFESELLMAWNGDHFERAIGVRFLLIADKGIGGVDRHVITVFVRKVDELG